MFMKENVLFFFFLIEILYQCSGGDERMGRIRSTSMPLLSMICFFIIRISIVYNVEIVVIL